MRRVVIRHHKFRLHGAFLATDIVEFWTADLSAFGKKEVKSELYDELLWRAQHFCRRECVRAPVLLLIADCEDHVRQAIEFAVAERALDPWEFTL